ncbi:hypothetical protein JCM10213_001920 [Rhodosporidiobolus nylandii]
MSDPGGSLVPDPRDDVVLPPWLWLTLCTLSLVCLLFISFRRGRALGLELYQRLVDKLPFSLHRGVRLAERDLEADPFSTLPRTHTPSADSDSDASSAHSDADELPHPSPSLRSYSFAPSPSPARFARSAAEKVQSGVGGVLETLGWGSRSASALGGSGQRGEKTAGIARVFWGVRKQDRTGGIRLESGRGLGDSSSSDTDRRSELSSVGGAISRIFDVAGGRRGGSGSGVRSQERTAGGVVGRHHRSTSASSAASGTALFDVGSEAEVGDAVELPAHFSLSSSSSARGNTSSGSSARDPQPV